MPSWASAAKKKRVEPDKKEVTSKRLKLALRVSLFVIGGLAFLVLAVYIRFSIADKTNGTVVSSGVTRKYLLYVPKSYEKSRPTPLVISLHGAAGWPALQSDISRWNDLADKHGFLVVYPAGTTLLGDRGPRVWPMGATSTDLDVKFISDLIAKLEGEYNIDASRVYADGLSNGGGMAYALGCKLSTRIAAVGAVAAALAMPDKMCDDARPEPVIAFHGTADKMAPFLGGKSGDPVKPQQFPSIRDWLDDWAGRNQCKDEPIDTPVAGSVHRLSYVNCVRGSDVVLYTIEGGGHQWPGGQPLPRWWVGPQINDVNATRTMWDFFVRHPRVQR